MRVNIDLTPQCTQIASGKSSGVEFIQMLPNMWHLICGRRRAAGRRPRTSGAAAGQRINLNVFWTYIEKNLWYKKWSAKRFYRLVIILVFFSCTCPPLVHLGFPMR